MNHAYSNLFNNLSCTLKILKEMNVSFPSPNKVMGLTLWSLLPYSEANVFKSIGSQACLGESWQQSKMSFSACLQKSMDILGPDGAESSKSEILKATVLFNQRLQHLLGQSFLRAMFTMYTQNENSKVRTLLPQDIMEREINQMWFSDLPIPTHCHNNHNTQIKAEFPLEQMHWEINQTIIWHPYSNTTPAQYQHSNKNIVPSGT